MKGLATEWKISIRSYGVTSRDMEPTIIIPFDVVCNVRKGIVRQVSGICFT